MTIVIETGTGTNAAANSYATIQQVRDFCARRGQVIAATDADVEIEMVLSMDYLESLYAQYQGNQTLPGTQPLQWPRDCVQVFGVDYPNNAIPQILIDAQCLLVLDQEVNGLSTTRVSPQFVTSEQIGPIKTTYSETIGTASFESGGPIMQAVTAKLQPLMSQSGGGLAPLRTYRI